MSRIFKGIGKIFKKIAKVVKKVLPAVLAIGAVVFTGGAALGLPALAGGWGAAAAGVVSHLGITGGVAQALTGAITFAGYGAATGGAMAALTGGSISQGMQTGALAGAAIGATGILSDPFAGIGMGHSATGGLAGAGTPAQFGQGGGVMTTSASTGATISAPMATPGSMAASAGSAAGSTAGSAAAGQLGSATMTTTSGTGGLLSRVGSWANANPVVAGSMISGIGAGISNYAAAGASANAESDLMQQRQEMIQQNYGGADPSQGFRGLARGQSGQTPAERFDPGSYDSFEYRYNPETARIERMPVGS